MRPDRFIEEIKKSYESKVEFTKEYLREHPEVAIAWSGGKDSTILVVLSREIGMSHPVVHVNSKFNFPEVSDYIKRLKRKYKIENYFEVENDDLNFDEFDKLEDFCFEVKFKPVIEPVLKHAKGEEFVSLRWQESQRWKEILKSGLSDKWHGLTRHFPLAFWGDRNVNVFYEKREDLNKLPLYSEGLPRSGCWVCPYANGNILKRAYPELYKKRKEYQEKYPEVFGV